LTRSRLFWRRSATALGTYGSAALGIAGTLIAANLLEPVDFGRFALVIATAALFQLLLDLTSEEALVKYGFRYSARGDWGRFRRLLALALAFKSVGGVVAGLIVIALAPFADSLFGTHGLEDPLFVAALLPLLQAGEGIAASVLVLRSRYDLRAWLLVLSTGLRLAAIAALASHGVTATVAGLAVAQALTTIAIGTLAVTALRRWPTAAPRPLGEDRPEILRFVLQSSIGTGIVSLRGWIAPLLLGVVGNVREVGYFRAAQAPQQGLAVLSSPVRLILLTEQTRDWEHGRPEAVFAGLRRYVLGASALMAVAVVPFWLLMPWLMRLVLPDYTPATDAARVILLAAAVQLVFGWTKSFPVSIGRPNLRILAHGIETVVLIPLIAVFGAEWGPTGAAVAVLVSTLVFAATWSVLLLRIKRQPLPRASLAPPTPTEVTVT
jgi:PST family polysaccharide transporter